MPAPFDFSALREQVIFTRGLHIPGDRTRFYAAVKAGRYVRLTRGAYVPAEALAGIDAAQRHLAEVTAVAMLRPSLVFSHVTAALCWGMPLVGSPPRRPEVLASSGGFERSNVAVIRHQVPSVEASEYIDGVPVTPLAHALAYVARTQPRSMSVPMLDYALRPLRPGEVWPVSRRVSKPELEWEGLRGTHVGSARLAHGVAFANGRSGSAGESLSRVCIDELGFPAPELQYEFVDERGCMFADFYWQHLRLVGEFDGFGKYLNVEYTRGRSVADVVMDEKRREDRLRSLGLTVVRWEWSDLTQPWLLRRKLESAGLRAGLSAIGAYVPAHSRQTGTN